MYQKLSLVICCVLATVAGSGQTYFTESFEGTWSGTPSAPAGWTNIDGTGTTNRAWEKATYSGGAWTPTGSGTKPAGAPNGSAVAHYNDFLATAGQVDKLQTPLVNLSASADPRIAFYYCYPAPSWSGSFKLYGSYDGGTTWNLLNTYSFTGSLALWTRIVLALPASYKVSNAKFSFEVTAGRGSADLWLDYVTVEEPVPPLTGTKTIKTSGGDYSSFTAAISALNDFGVGTGGVTFLVDAGLVTIEDCPIITATGTSSDPIIFQKSGTGANPLIRATGSTAMRDAGIVIAGGDYITFDGIDITIHTGSDLEVGYYLYNISATNGAQNNTIRNAKITLNRTNTSSVGINQSILVSPTSQASGCNNGNKYYNITVENSYCGISLYGNSSTLYDSGCEIGSTGGGTTTIGAATPNDIGNGSNRVNGIQAYYQSGIKIFNTVIRNVTGTSTTLRATGLFLYYSYGTSAIYNNKIGPVTSSATTASNTNYLASGMILDPAYGHTVNVYNNFIFGISTGQTTATSSSASTITQAAGIELGETSGAVNLYFNNIRMEANTNINSACILGSGIGSNPPIVLKNNVFANLTASQSGTPAHYGIMRQGSSGTITTTDYNDYYIPNPGNGYVGYYSGNKTTLADWKGILTPNQDQHSITADPVFASVTDLHSSSADLIGAGVTVSTANGDTLDIATDIDGETRGIPPAIGADEFNLFDRSSKAEAPASQVGSASVPSTATSTGTAVNVLRLKITDTGSGDGMPTNVTNVRITNANPSNGANWIAAIAGVKLNNGAGDIVIGTPVITASFIDIPIPAGNLSVPDASSSTITLSVFLKTSGIEDGKKLQFTIPATGHGFTASGSGSLFIADFGAAVTGNVHTLTVAATRLTFSGVPSTVMSNTGFSATVSATDDNGNTDVDKSFAVTLALNTGSGALSSATGLTQPLSAGTRTWPDLAYSTTGTFKIQADGGSLAQGTTTDINSINEIIVGTSTASTQAYPFDVSFGFSRNAALYLQSEIGFFFPISKLSWQIATAQTTNCPVKIYLKKTTATTVTADTWANMISGATLVYDGTVQFTPAGWFDFLFSSSFTYDEGNLLVLTEGNYGASGNTSYPAFYYTTATNKNASQHADTSPPTANLTVGDKRPNLRIPLPVTKSIADITVNQASTDLVTSGSSNREILRLDFPVSGFIGTLFLNSITVTSNNTNDNDISGVKLYRTSSPVFSTANPLGTPTLFSGGTATFSSLGYDLPAGTTYIWVACDISGNAINNDV
ncbi:MAG TPA: hypothetical protein PLK82_10280, partial [Bacteroidales bacterium]|nr:hypothetical protein [Bacteroidales bacterium]